MKKIVAAMAVITVIIMSTSTFAKPSPDTEVDACSTNPELRCGVKKGGVTW